MLKHYFFSVLFFVLGTLHVQAQSISEHGYRYVHHIQRGGQKPQLGEGILANVDVYVGNSLLSSSKKNSTGSYRYDLPAASEEVPHYPPIMDAALLMSKGDSLTIYQAVDDNMRKFLPLEEKEAKEIRFEIVMLDFITMEQKAVAAKALDAAIQQIGQKVQAKAKSYGAGLLNAEVKTYPSGLKMLVEVAGRGAPVQKGEALQVHYYGCLTNGSSFDNSFSRRQPLQFPAGEGQMIAGFDEAVLYLNHGSHAYLFVPPALGYGDQDAAGGSIPANSELVFYIEIL